MTIARQTCLQGSNGFGASSDDLENVRADKDDSPTDHSESARRWGAKIKDAPVAKRATVVYRNDDAAPRFRIGYANSRTEW
jgi:hypothetical protein